VITVTDGGTDLKAEQEAIRELLVEYALSLDADDVKGCVELFTEDGDFVVYGKTLTGRDKIGRMFTRAPNGLHLIGATHIEVQGSTAAVRSQVLFVDAATHDMRPALYDDALTKTGDRWQFRSRRCQFITADGLSDTPQQGAQAQ
jgi:uncharacterized protein (TIGR02246 family)